MDIWPVCKIKTKDYCTYNTFVHYIDVWKNAAGHGLEKHKRALLYVVFNKNYFDMKVQEEEFTELNTTWSVTVWYTVCKMSIFALNSWKINTYNQEPVMVFMDNTEEHIVMCRIPLKKCK